MTNTSSTAKSWCWRKDSSASKRLQVQICTKTMQQTLELSVTHVVLKTIPKWWFYGIGFLTLSFN